MEALPQTPAGRGGEPGRAHAHGGDRARVHRHHRGLRDPAVGARLRSARREQASAGLCRRVRRRRAPSLVAAVVLTPSAAALPRARGRRRQAPPRLDTVRAPGVYPVARVPRRRRRDASEPTMRVPEPSPDHLEPCARGRSTIASPPRAVAPAGRSSCSSIIRPCVSGSPRSGSSSRFHSTLPGADRELAILTAGRESEAPYEWVAHEPVAHQGGYATRGDRRGARRPSDPRPHAARGAARRYGSRAVPSAPAAPRTQFARAEAELGRQGLIELVTLAGYYGMVAAVLNAFEVDLPPGHDATIRSPSTTPTGARPRTRASGGDRRIAVARRRHGSVRARPAPGSSRDARRSAPTCSRRSRLPPAWCHASICIDRESRIR